MDIFRDYFKMDRKPRGKLYKLFSMNKYAKTPLKVVVAMPKQQIFIAVSFTLKPR